MMIDYNYISLVIDILISLILLGYGIWLLYLGLFKDTGARDIVLGIVCWQLSQYKTDEINEIINLMRGHV